MNIDTAFDAIWAVAQGDIRDINHAIEWAREHDIEIPNEPRQMDTNLNHGFRHEAREAYPKRMLFILNICDHIRSKRTDDVQ